MTATNGYKSVAKSPEPRHHPRQDAVHQLPVTPPRAPGDRVPAQDGVIVQLASYPSTNR